MVGDILVKRRKCKGNGGWGVCLYREELILMEERMVSIINMLKGVDLQTSSWPKTRLQKMLTRGERVHIHVRTYVLSQRCSDAACSMLRPGCRDVL